MAAILEEARHTNLNNQAATLLRRQAIARPAANGGGGQSPDGPPQTPKERALSYRLPTEEENYWVTTIIEEAGRTPPVFQKRRRNITRPVIADAQEVVHN